MSATSAQPVIQTTVSWDCGRGYCSMHYRRLSNTGDPGEVESRTNQDLDRTCQAEGCDRPWTSKKYCDKHYRRFKANGDPLVLKVGGKPKAFRNAENCDRPAFGHGLCNMHYKRSRKTGP